MSGGSPRKPAPNKSVYSEQDAAFYLNHIKQDQMQRARGKSHVQRGSDKSALSPIKRAGQQMLSSNALK